MVQVSTKQWSCDASLRLSNCISYPPSIFPTLRTSASCFSRRRPDSLPPPPATTACRCSNDLSDPARLVYQGVGEINGIQYLQVGSEADLYAVLCPAPAPVLVGSDTCKL